MVKYQYNNYRGTNQCHLSFFVVVPFLIIVLGIAYLIYKNNQRKQPKNCTPEYNYQQPNTPNYAIPTPAASEMNKSGLTASGCLGAFVFIIAVVAIMIWIIPGIRSGYNKAKEQHDVQSNAAQYTEEEYKQMCRPATYEEIARDGNAKSGEYFTFSGEVLQEIQDGVYRLAVNDDSDYIIFSFESSGDRILEGDTVTIWGESTGFAEGETILGAAVKAPKIEAVYVTIENVDSKTKT